MNTYASRDDEWMHPAVTPHHSKAIILAWAVEIIAVAMGLVLAVFAGIEGSDSGLMAIIISTLPFIALSVVELMKIPLVGLAFKVHSNIWRMLAIIALLFITLATFQNFVFGFERGFNERIRVVETAQQAFRNKQNEATIAASQVKQLEARQKDVEAQIADLDKRVNAISEQAQSDIANTHANDTTAALIREREQLQTDLSQIEQHRTAETTAELARCRVAQSTCFLAAINGRWNKQRDQIMTRLAAIDDQMKAAHDQATTEMTEARANRDTGTANLNKQRADLQHQLDSARDMLADAQVQSLHAEAAVTEAQHTRDLLVDRSQLHRLSDVIFGNHENDALEKTKKLFVVSLAFIVAVIGSIIATMYYATQVNVAAMLRDARENRRQRNLMWRTIRSYYAHKRFGLIQEKMVIKEVPIDRLKLVFLPEDASEEDIKRAREDALKSARPAKGEPVGSAA